MSENTLEDFIAYCKKHIKGDEKGEAQIYMDRFFTALGYEHGLKGAGAECEFRIRNDKKKSTSFADLVWNPRVLIEMKKRGEDLTLHYQQAFSYWLQLVPNRPQYVILCNFDEFWIYDFNNKLYDPIDTIKLGDLEKHKQAFAFLLPTPYKPVFGKDKSDITEKAASYVASAYKSMINKSTRVPLIEKDIALRYCLQCILTMFAEDVGLLPDKIFTRLIEECVTDTGMGRDLIKKSYDLIGGLFREMNKQGVSEGDRYRGVEYFNGGLFSEVHSIELTKMEVDYFEAASSQSWQNVNPAIFGTIFEQFMEGKERHMRGAHYTHETDIMKIVDPVIVQPWKRKIEQADTLDELYQLIRELRSFKVLDPSCGSGNFLFIAFKEMKLIEKSLLIRIKAQSTKPADAKILTHFLLMEPYVSIKQFYGIDIKDDAVELAKVTLMVAKELWVTQNKDIHDNEDALPLDNLDENIICADALLTTDGKPRIWPEVDAIIGNPPYQSKNKMLSEFGGEYTNKLWDAYPEMNKYADFCTYWFYKAHQRLKEGGYAGLVGTNSIRQNNSRESSLDYIVNNNGTIIEAVSSEPWSGEAAVHVSIVCWKKGEEKSKKNLYYPDSKGNLELHKQDVINSSLSLSIDVVTAYVLECNKTPKKCFQGQTHGHEGFLLTIKEALKLLKENKKNAEVLKPYLIGEELVGSYNSQPKRFVIDFTFKDMNTASSFLTLFKIIKDKVLPWREEMANKQLEENQIILKNNLKAKVNKDYINQYNKWWLLRRQKEDLLNEIASLKRYVACARVTQRPIFEFFDVDIRANDKVMVFAFDDNYSFGIIQSNIHWQWFLAKCTTLGETPNYNTDAIWNTFPWPQTPTQKQIEKVAKASKELRDVRNNSMHDYHYSLRDLYRILEQPGKNPIKDLHTALDKAVMEAYGFDESKDLLTQLLALNLEVHEKEKKKEKVQPPGLPDWVKDKEKLVSDDCVRWEG